MRLLIIVLFLSSISYAQFPNVRVSAPNSNNPEEVTIAINPVDPNILAAGANIDYFYISTDGGNTWKESTLQSSLGVWGDPCVVFDDSGYIYFAHLSNPVNGYWIDRIVVQRSTDYGATWNDGVGIGLKAPRNQDKEWLAVDLTNSQYHGNIYMSWTEFDDYGNQSDNCHSRILFSRSTDRGLTWSEPITISDFEGNCIDEDETAEGAVPAVGPNGEIYIAYALNEKIYFTKSLDGGKSFSRNKEIMTQPGGWDFSIPGISRANGLPVTMCDVSNSPFRGNIYVLVSDQRNGISNTDVFITRSTDSGITWSDPIKVNSDNSSRHQFFCWGTVDSSTGNIYVSYYDRRNTSDVNTEFYLARSTDGGQSFEEFKITDEHFTPTRNVFFGDYTGISAYKGKIYPIWMELQNYNLSVWTALIEDSLLITSVQKDDIQPSEFKVYQNFPNPFNPSTIIPVDVLKPGLVKVTVSDILGRVVRKFSRNFQTAGRNDIELKLIEEPSGIYFYTVSNGAKSFTKKMILLK